jgi:hypothetical protein
MQQAVFGFWMHKDTPRNQHPILRLLISAMAHPTSIRTPENEPMDYFHFHPMNLEANAYGVYCFGFEHFKSHVIILHFY